MYFLYYRYQGANLNTNNICGIKDTSTPLVYGGDEIVQGDWPWVVRIYGKDRAVLRLLGGGSLVNTRSVITAAHIVRRASAFRQPSEILVWLGRHNIDNWAEKGALIAEIERILPHPDYKLHSEESFDADIAILTMKQPVSYTKYIRPICLWPATSSSQDVIGKTGTIVGWGIDETGVVSNTQKKINLPITDILTCVRTSNKLISLASNRTFCAGLLKGNGPCNGDSG